MVRGGGGEEAEGEALGVAPTAGRWYLEGMTADRKYAVEVELPAEAFRHRQWSASDVASDLRLLWLVDQVRQRRLGYAKAAELAGMPQAAFERVLAVHHVSPFDMDEDELDREIAAGLDVGRA
jgi:predicted HTH domain antitoxin